MSQEDVQQKNKEMHVIEIILDNKMFKMQNVTKHLLSNVLDV